MQCGKQLEHIADVLECIKLYFLTGLHGLLSYCCLCSELFLGGMYV
jgi:uncharacterized membrane protein